MPSCSACQEREAIALSQGCTGCQMTCTPTAAPPELCTISGCQGQQGSCPMYNVKKTAVPSCVACYQLKYTAISFGCTGPFENMFCAAIALVVLDPHCRARDPTP